MTIEAQIFKVESDFSTCIENDPKVVSVERGGEVTTEVAGLKVKLQDYFNPDTFWVSGSTVEVEFDPNKRQRIEFEGDMNSVEVKPMKSGQIFSVADIKKGTATLYVKNGRRYERAEITHSE